MSKDVENLRKHERVLNHIDIIKNKLSSNSIWIIYKYSN